MTFNYFIVKSGKCTFDKYGIVARKFTDSICFGGIIVGGRDKLSATVFLGYLPWFGSGVDYFCRNCIALI